MKKSDDIAKMHIENTGSDNAVLYSLTTCLLGSGSIKARLAAFVDGLAAYLGDATIRAYLYEEDRLPKDLTLLVETGREDTCTVTVNDGLRDTPRIHRNCWTALPNDDSPIGIRTLFACTTCRVQNAGIVPLVHNDIVYGCLLISRASSEEVPVAKREMCLRAGANAGFALDQAITLERALKREERFALAVHGSDDGLWDWDLVTNQVFLSARFQAMLGETSAPQEVDIATFLSRIHPDDADSVQDALISHKSGITQQFSSEHRVLHKDGMYRWVTSRAKSVRNPTGTRIRVVGIQTDITERRNAYDQLVHDAFHDTLTHLPNRALFTNRLNHAFARSKGPEGHRFAVMSISLDRFKALNDALGYETGDRLLVEVAERLMGCVSEMDTVARLERDQFAVLLGDHSDSLDPARSASRIQETIGGPLEIDGNHIAITTSIGVTTNDSNHATAETILRDSLTAMYRANSNGLDQICHFDPKFHELAVTKLQLEFDLRHAVEREEFCLEYQPIYSFEEARVVGMEALLRWNHPSLGRLLPGRFIDMAEETGLIIPIGEWVLQESCRQAAEWQKSLGAAFPSFMSINLAPQQLSDPAFGQFVENTFEATGVEPSQIKLEITERMLLAGDAIVREALDHIRALGAHLAIDDFGTGYSALSYLMNFEMDELKLDRSFVQGLANDAQRQKVVGAVVTLAHNLGMTVTAEGIEQESERLIVKRIGCDLAQGYLFGRPVEAEVAFKALVNASRKEDAKVVKLPSM